jgi:hypothetical protein
MVLFVKTHGLKLIAIFALIYLMFFLNLGTRTLGQHLWRIAGTPEARELYSEVGGTVASATSAVTRKLRRGSSSTNW